MSILLILLGCNEKKERIKQKIEKETISSASMQEDTIYNYWALNTDTITNRNKINIAELEYLLELKTYSLNDSLIVRNLGQTNKKNYYDYSHTLVTDITLLSDSTFDQTQIDKQKFEQSLFSDFYKECNLYSTNLDSIKENKIYLNSDLAIPDSDNQWRVWYSIKIKKNKLEQLEIINSDYVGL
jgi:hypothetical protein